MKKLRWLAILLFAVQAAAQAADPGQAKAKKGQAAAEQDCKIRARTMACIFTLCETGCETGRMPNNCLETFRSFEKVEKDEGMSDALRNINRAGRNGVQVYEDSYKLCMLRKDAL